MAAIFPKWAVRRTWAALCARIRGSRAQGEPEHGQGWETCESFCHAAFLSCFSKKKRNISIYLYIYVYKNPSAKCNVLCLLFLGVLLPGRQEVEGGDGEGGEGKT